MIQDHSPSQTNLNLQTAITEAHVRFSELQLSIDFVDELLDIAVEFW